MRSENQNNPNWKNKLEDETDLSSEILLNKNIAWEKLHSRLQDKPRRKKFLWYWLAAACLLPAIFVSLMVFIMNEEKALKNIVIKEKAAKPEINQMQEIKTDSIAADFVFVSKKKKTSKIKLKSNNNTIAGTDKEHFEANIQIANNEIIPPISVADSSNKTNISRALPKKILKVVHINELGEPAEELPETAHQSNLHYFQLKLASQEIYRNTSLTLNNTGINLFKTKTSPSN